MLSLDYYYHWQKKIGRKYVLAWTTTGFGPILIKIYSTFTSPILILSLSLSCLLPPTPFPLSVTWFSCRTGVSLSRIRSSQFCRGDHLPAPCRPQIMDDFAHGKLIPNASIELRNPHNTTAWGWLVGSGLVLPVIWSRSSLRRWHVSALFLGALKGARVDGMKWTIVKDWFVIGGPTILSRGCSETTLAFLVRLHPRSTGSSRRLQVEQSSLCIY